MVIGRLFDLLTGELVDIVEYAVECHKKTRRSPRLAVNASSWWYTNMTAATAQALRDKEGIHLNPIERNILFYTLRVLQLGIQLHFVFDGPKRLSSGGKTYPGHDPPSPLFQDTLTQIGVPSHEAPAEAEAECAKMEMEGVVDGVWSEDGAALAFGCKTLVKSHFEIRSSTERSEDRRKSFTHFKIYKLEDIAAQYAGMDRAGFILHAILNGKPSIIGQLYDLGPLDVLNAAGRGIGRSLCAASESEKHLRLWATTDLAVYLKDTSSDIQIPPNFPRREHVQDYLNPVASTPETLSGLQRPRPRDTLPDEQTLFSFLVDKFQWTINQWGKYIMPVRIVQSLLATEEGKASDHDYLELECNQTKKTMPIKAKATFLLCKATSLDVSALYEPKKGIKTRGVLETPMWILRKANFNKQRSIASFLMTPNSLQKGKGKSSEPGSGKLLLPLDCGATLELLTPPTGSASSSASNLASSSNGEGPSTRSDRPKRQNTPPTPTPASKKRRLPFGKGARITKNIRPAPKNNHGNAVQTIKSAKGKRKESDARPNTETLRLPTDSNSSFFEELGDKGQKPAREQLPSTPPAGITEPTNAVNGFVTITIDSDSDEELHDKLTAEQLRSTPPVQTPQPNDFIMVDSDSDEDAYGSFPSGADLSTVLEDTATKAIHREGPISSSSADEYGSFPASPDLRTLT